MNRGDVAMAGVESCAGDLSRTARPSRTGHRYVTWLLALPFAGLLVPPIYAFDRPTVIGIPFFYWNQILWLALTALVTTVVYRARRSDRARGEA